MSVGCRICALPMRAAIDLALLHGGSVRAVARDFDLGDWSALARHRRKHLPDVLATARLETEARVRQELRPEVDTVLNTLWQLYRELGVCCRPHVLAVIQQLETRHEPDRRMGNPDSRT